MTFELMPSLLETLYLTNLLEVSIGRDFGALKGLGSPAKMQKIYLPKKSEFFFAKKRCIPEYITIARCVTNAISKTNQLPPVVPSLAQGGEGRSCWTAQSAVSEHENSTIGKLNCPVLKLHTISLKGGIRPFLFLLFIFIFSNSKNYYALFSSSFSPKTCVQL